MGLGVTGRGGSVWRGCRQEPELAAPDLLSRERTRLG